jgi:hypothetical protein
MTRKIRVCRVYPLTRSTSPSGEKLKAEIAVVTTVSDVVASKLGSPGGPLASKTLIFITLH